MYVTKKEAIGLIDAIETNQKAIEALTKKVIKLEKTLERLSKKGVFI